MNSSEWITPRKGKSAKADRKQLPRQVYQFAPIVLIPSSNCNDTITLEESAAEFNVYYTLVKAGAKWGDIEVFDLEEWTDLLEQRQRAPVDFVLDNTMDALVESGLIKRAIVSEPEPEPEPEPRVVFRPPCEVCGVYLSHSDPPADFKGRNLCCGWCLKQKGKDHGERCERCEIYTKNTDGVDYY
jgi:hypothetical protein